MDIFKVIEVSKMIARESRESLEFLETLIGKKPTLGDYLLAIRQGEELSQAAFASKLEISRKKSTWRRTQ